MRFYSQLKLQEGAICVLKEHRISKKVICFFGDILMSQAKKLNPNAIEIILDIDVRMMISEQIQSESPQGQEGE